MSNVNNSTLGWITALIVIAVLFLLAMIISFEYGSTVTQQGDVQLAWYGWLFLALAFVCYFICIMIYIFSPTVKTGPTSKNSDEKTVMTEPAINYNYNISHTNTIKDKLLISQPSMNDLDSLRR